MKWGPCAQTWRQNWTHCVWEGEKKMRVLATNVIAHQPSGADDSRPPNPCTTNQAYPGQRDRTSSPCWTNSRPALHLCRRRFSSAVGRPEEGSSSKGVFVLTFGFGFCPPKSQKPTKRLDPGSSFFLKADFLVVQI
jgi:hypothetical protein